VPSEHATEDVTAATRRPAARTLPKPWNPDGRDITEYPDFELVKFMRWIMSDGVLRTRGELIVMGAKEFGYERRGSRIVAALGRAIDTIQRTDAR
jgi:hypothetical protein